jgi:hypothetical protein
MTDPKVNQSDRDARARECLAAEYAKARFMAFAGTPGGITYRRDEAALRAMLSFAQAEVGCVPEGFVLVPREPTDSMLCWGVEAMWPGPEAVYPDEHEGVEAAIRATWSAMLAAAPTPEAQS